MLPHGRCRSDFDGCTINASLPITGYLSCAPLNASLPNVSGSRFISILAPPATLQRSAGSVVGGGDAEDGDEAAIVMVRTGFDTFMPAEPEARERAAVSEMTVEETRAKGLALEGLKELRELMLNFHFQAFR